MTSRRNADLANFEDKRPISKTDFAFCRTLQKAAGSATVDPIRDVNGSDWKLATRRQRSSVQFAFC